MVDHFFCDRTRDDNDFFHVRYMPLELTHDSRVCCENHIPGDLFLLSEAADHYIFNFNGISKHKLEIPGQIFSQGIRCLAPRDKGNDRFFQSAALLPI